MILYAPNRFPHREDSSSLELERMIDPFKHREDSSFYSWDRYDYSDLVEARKKDKIDRCCKL